MVVVTPPFQAFDEHSHYFRAWSVAQGEFDPGEDGRVTLPANVADLPSRFHFIDVFRGGLRYDPSLVGRVIWDRVSLTTSETLTSAANYGPLGYMPQAAGIEVARLVGRSPLLGLYLGRLVNLICAVLLTFAAIRIVPFGKPVVALLALFPTTVFLSASLSPDALAISGVVLFVCVAVRYSVQDSLTWREFATFSLGAIVLLNFKPGYLAFSLLILLVTPKQAGTWIRYAMFVIGTLGLVAAISLLLMRIGPNGENQRVFSSALGAGDMSVNPSAQLAFVLAHPWAFTKVVWWTMAEGAYGWAANMIGSLGWGNVGLALPMIVAFWLGLLVAMGVSRPVALGAGRRLVLVLTAMVAVVSVLAGLYLYANAVAAPRIGGVQGRYFTPAMAPLLLSVTGLSLKSESRVARIVLAASALVFVIALAVVGYYYY